MSLIAANEPLQYLQTIETHIKIALPPSLIDKPLNAVKGQLNKTLFQYHEKIGGIPMGYGDLRFPEGKKYGRFFADHPWVHIDIICDFIVFKPNVGDRMYGKVSKVSDNNVAILVFSLFNASISGDELKRSFAFNSSENQW